MTVFGQILFQSTTCAEHCVRRTVAAKFFLSFFFSLINILNSLCGNQCPFFFQFAMDLIQFHANGFDVAVQFFGVSTLPILLCLIPLFYGNTSLNRMSHILPPTVRRIQIGASPFFNSFPLRRKNKILKDFRFILPIF